MHLFPMDLHKSRRYTMVCVRICTLEYRYPGVMGKIYQQELIELIANASFHIQRPSSTCRVATDGFLVCERLWSMIDDHIFRRLVVITLKRYALHTNPNV
jgi:hypothetical protein